MKFKIRHESLTTSWTHFFSVMKCCSLRHEFVHFVISLSYPATTSWSHGLMGASKLHIFTHQALRQSPQAQHQGVQGFSVFIQSCLQTEFLLVLRIVTPVSVARTGGGICRQIVQFRTFCGGLTSLACRVSKILETKSLPQWTPFGIVWAPPCPSWIVRPGCVCSSRVGQCGVTYFWRRRTSHVQFMNLHIIPMNSWLSLQKWCRLTACRINRMADCLPLVVQSVVLTHLAV